MATSGSKSVTVTAHDTLKFSWAQASQSVSNNSTKISWQLQLVAGAYGRISSTASKDWSVTVNGTTYKGTNTVGISNSSTKTLASGSTTIAHNSDGTKTFNYSFSQEFGITFSGASVGTKTGSGSGTLNTIPRATTPTASATSVNMGSTVTISLPRASSSFTHNLTYRFAGATVARGTIATGVGTSYTWTVPDLASHIPAATFGTLSVTVQTVNGSTNVGSKTLLLTAKVPTSVVPTISAATFTETTSGVAAQFGTLVKSKSAVKAAITAAGAKGATIKSISSTLLGKAYTGSSWTSSTLTNAGTVAVVTTVTDTRGRTAKKTTNLKVTDYSPPKIQRLTVHRVDAEGNPDDQGTLVAVDCQYSVASVGGKNTASAVFEYRQHGTTTWTDLAVTSALSFNSTLLPKSATLSIDNQYDIRLTLTDWFGASVTYTATLPTAEVILDIKADGKGLAFGKVAEVQGLDLRGWDFAGSTAGTGSGSFEIGGYLIQWGGVNITPTAAGEPTTAVVRFPQAYVAQPAVFVTPVSSVPHQLSVGVQRAASLVGDVRQAIAITLTREGTTNTGINWLAIGRARALELVDAAGYTLQDRDGYTLTVGG